MFTVSGLNNDAIMLITTVVVCYCANVYYLLEWSNFGLSVRLDASVKLCIIVMYMAISHMSSAL